MKRTPLKKKSRDPVKTLQRKCDALLTPIIKKLHPICLLRGLPGAERCTGDTQVAHHHVHKSKSNRLRHEIDNLIPLCNHCHLMLHNNESYWASKIVEIRGIEWFQRINRMKQETIKTDAIYYVTMLEKLKILLTNCK